ncbi:MAG: hypothetical protein K0B11_10575 [Mariniphaga sp.]|nr:hypothetical protein [Mariniphaga sp.]
MPGIVPVRPAANQISVKPNHGKRHGSVNLKEDGFTCIGFWMSSFLRYQATPWLGNLPIPPPTSGFGPS